MVTTKKKWTAKKGGGYGWTYTRTVTYTCGYQNDTTTGHTTRPIVPVSRSLVEGCSSNRGVKNSISNDVLEQPDKCERIKNEKESSGSRPEVSEAGRD